MLVIENKAATLEQHGPQQVEDDRNKAPKVEQLQRITTNPWMWLLGLTAWMGIFNSFNMRLYTSGFILKFSSDHGINKTICNATVSCFLLSATVAPIIVKRTGFLSEYSIKRRTWLYGGFMVVCNTLFVLADYIVLWDRSHISLYVFFTIMRLLQGFCGGVLLILFQGEIVDVFFKGNTFVAGCISSAIHMTTAVGGVLSASLYERGGWSYTAPLFSFLFSIPVISFQFINLEKAKVILVKEGGNLLDGKEEEIESTNTKTKVELTVCQRIAFMSPDLVVLCNNAIYNMLVYSIPYRLLYSNSYSLTVANLYITLMSVSSFISTFALSYATDHFNTIVIMIIGNVSFYVGAVCTYGSTTPYLLFPGAMELGSILVGFGDAAIISLCVISKFHLYKVWKRDIKSVGVKAATYFNFAVSMSAVLGIVLSGVTSSRESEIPTLIVNGISFLMTLTFLIFCVFIR